MGRMYERGTDNIFYAICNTDFQDLNRSDVPCKITLGENLCNGRGCGANSKKGKAAAEESIDEISSLFGDGSIVFIIAGMGGGTGTGAAPVIAKTAKEKGHLTIGVVTMPFSWEQENRINKAKDGLRNMLATTDAIMVFNNQQISRTYEDRPVSEGFKEADDIIASATLGIADIVENPFVLFDSSSGKYDCDAESAAVVRNGCYILEFEPVVKSLYSGIKVLVSEDFLPVEISFVSNQGIGYVVEILSFGKKDVDGIPAGLFVFEPGPETYITDLR